MRENNNTDPTDEEIAYYTGYMEAYLTYSLMDSHYQNTMQKFCSSDSEQELCQKLMTFIFNNVIYIAGKNLTDPLWYQVMSIVLKNSYLG